MKMVVTMEMGWKVLVNKRVKTIISVLVIVVIWGIVSNLNIYSEYLLPSPYIVLVRFFNLLSNKVLITNVIISLQRVFTGYFIALVLAIIFAIISLLYPGLMEYFDGIIQFFRNVPPLGLIPLLILWFGIGEKSKLIVIILASFFSMYLSIEKGFKSTDIKLIEVGKSFGFNKWKIFRKVIIPSSIPDVLVGMRVGMGYSYRAIIGAEMIASSSGLGYMINFARSMSQTDIVIVGIIVIGLLGYLCDLVFKKLIDILLKDTKGYGWN